MDCLRLQPNRTGEGGEGVSVTQSSKNVMIMTPPPVLYTLVVPSY